MTLTNAAPGKKGAASTGPPDEPLEGGWPPGWTRKVFERQSGAKKGRRDRYWYSPIKQYQFRSMKQVKTFLYYVKKLGGDEVRAHAMLKSSKTHFTMKVSKQEPHDGKESPQGLNQSTEQDAVHIANCTSKINVGWDDKNKEEVGDDNEGAVNKKDLAGKQTEKEKLQEKIAEDAESKTATDDGDDDEKAGEKKQAEEEKQEEKKTEDDDDRTKGSKPGTFGKYIPLQADDEDEYANMDYKSKATGKTKDGKRGTYRKSTLLERKDDKLGKDKHEKADEEEDDDASEESEENYVDSEEEDNDSEYEEEEEEDLEEGVDKSRHKASKRAPSPTTQLSNYVLKHKGQPTSDDEESKHDNALPQASAASILEQRAGQSKTSATSKTADIVTEQEPCSPSFSGAHRSNTPSSPDSASRKRSAASFDSSTEGPGTNIIQALLSTKTTQSEKNTVLAAYDTWKASKATLETTQNQVSQAEKALVVARKLNDQQKEAHRMASEAMNALIRDNLHPDGRTKRQKRFMPPK